MINNEVKSFFENLFRKPTQNIPSKLTTFLDDITTPRLSNTQKSDYERDISEAELIKALSSMCSNKTPGNDGLTKEFYETFWDVVKQPFLNSINQTKVAKNLQRRKDKLSLN